jgi:hypothetical protein
MAGAIAPAVFFGASALARAQGLPERGQSTRSRLLCRSRSFLNSNSARQSLSTGNPQAPRWHIGDPVL